MSPAAAPGGPTAEPVLGIQGFRYADLHDPARLADLYAEFRRFLAANDAALATRHAAWMDGSAPPATPEALSELILEVAPHVGAFIARLFAIEPVRESRMAAAQAEFEVLFRFRAEVVLACPAEATDAADFARDAAVVDCLRRHGWADVAVDDDEERAVATLGLRLVHLAAHPEAHAEELAALVARLAVPGADLLAEALALHPAACVAHLAASLRRYIGALRAAPSRVPAAAGWMILREPAKTDWRDLVEHEVIDAGVHEAWMGPRAHRRRRVGFALTDPRMSTREVFYEVDHCIYCHDRDADSCSKGMRNRRDGTFKTNPLGVTITGCPLGEKISEMHALKRRGDDIAALAVVMIDNPMCPGTGHRICNDCMKGCIYQKTEPVNIPQIETNVLTEVLFAPWGFEIYGLLTRFNPLNAARPHALPYNGRNVLVVGLGPAGYTLAHYLLNEGFGVVGIDALKLEPLPEDLTGAPGRPPRAVHDYRELYERLDERVLAGFGGVAEYGITVRWDKNFLKVIYLTLLRRGGFRCYGGVRFGGTLTLEDAWELGFHHVAIASGAGRPTVIDLANNMVRGIRKASDFLMGLQLTGAAKADSLANLQLRLPAGVIGGGLTAIDTTTEAMAYYPVQVEKTLARYEHLVERHGEETVRRRFDAEELGLLDEFLGHGRAVRAERERAEAVGETPDFASLVESWGGVTLYYRKGIKDSPAYRQNHEEIAEALEEGIRLAEGMDPREALTDEWGALRAVRFTRRVEREGRWEEDGDVTVPLRSLFIAAGTSPNTIYEMEHPGTFAMDRRFFRRHAAVGAGGALTLEPVADAGGIKTARPAPLTSYQHDGHHVSFYGDNHPVYAGNVVKAMASARDGYPHIVALFAAELAALDPARQPARDAALAALHARLDAELRATVVAVHRLTPTIVEVIAHAPLAARKFHPGQFYRVQNLEALAPVVDGTPLAAEGLALTGAWVDAERGLISLITLEMGSSSRLCALWQPGEPLVVMGVTGAPTEIPRGRTVMLVGGGLGNAVQFSIGKALRAAGSRVIYFAGYKRATDVFKVEEIEAAADVIVWAVDPGPGVTPIPTTRPQDMSHVGNILDTIEAYARGDLGPVGIPLHEVEHMVVIGSDRMMAAVKEARHGRLARWLRPGHEAIGSINSPMQCMMKGVCAQCLCRHVDPETGEVSYVYSCFNQDQPLDRVDFGNLNARLRQNSVQEKLSDLWLDLLLERRAAQVEAAGAG